ncbi:MAG: DUF6438 domain-containing protein, partial [Bacteroidota bacterium]
MKKPYLFLLMLFAFVGLQAQEDFLPDTDLKEMEMYKSACFGKCPSYKLTIYKNKLAVYEGYSNVEKEGIWTKKLSGAEYKKVCKAYKKSGFADIENNFFDNRIADAPITTLSYKTGSAMSVLKKNLSWTEVLDDLEMKMEAVGNSSGWELKKKPMKLEDKRNVDYIPDEIIVTLNKDTN